MQASQCPIILAAVTVTAVTVDAKMVSPSPSIFHSPIRLTHRSQCQIETAHSRQPERMAK